MEQKKYLCQVVKRENGSVVKELSKCPASADTLLAALHFLDEDMKLELSITDSPVLVFSEAEAS